MIQDNTGVSKERMGEIIFSSWNVKGINEPVKRGKVLAHLKSLNSGIIFLQETHLKKDSHLRLRCRWISQVYHSSFPFKTRGVAIIIRKGVHFKHHSTIADREGRYVIVVGELYSRPVTMLNIYGPNQDDPEFFRKVFGLIPDISSTNLVAPSNSSKLLNTYIKNMNLCDIWRISNPTGREYSFHSHVHNVYTRIDYFLIDGNLLQYSGNPKYHNIIISDHCPVTFSFRLSDTPRQQGSWRFNPQLLTDSVFCKYIKTHVNIFLETNNKPETAPSLLWETLKAYLRGCIISFQASRRKQNKEEQLKLEDQIQKLEAENAQYPSKDKYNQILTLKYQLNKILSEKISKAFMFTKQKYFEFGDKPQKLLARQLRKLENERSIHRIKSDTGETLTSHKDINERFQQFYERLYTSQMKATPGDMQAFLDECQLPSLNQTEREYLGAEITCEEIKESIKSLKNGKSPGPDGFSSEFYKKFSDLLVPYLNKMFGQAFDNGELPHTLNEAIITLIPKARKDLEEVGSYRPISLLNTDQKILTKNFSQKAEPLDREAGTPRPDRVYSPKILIL